MSPPNRMLTIQLVTLVWSWLISSLVVAYTSSQTSSSSRPFVHPLDLQEIQAMRRTTTTKHFPTKDEVMSTTRGRYDLGIGKNPPFIRTKNGTRDPSSSPSSLVQPSSLQNPYEHHHSGEEPSSTTQYLVEHYATREYPSPLLQIQTPTPPPPQVMPKVQHERRVRDVLQIDHPPHHSYHSDDVDDHASIPTTQGGAKKMKPILPLIRASSNVQLDVNTVWVEMMLHSEHMKSVSMMPSAVA